jgi:acetyl-CoA acetyltransferase
MNNYYLPDLAGFPDAEQCAARLWDQTGLRPSDIDVAEIYENFSPLALMVLEAFGFCGRGEAAGYIASGAIGLDGELPVNTHGGLLGEAYIHGMNTLIEGVRQARGAAANQIADVEHVLVSSLSSAVILRAS